MSKIFKIIANSIVYSNLWISLGSVAFSLVASVFLKYELPFQFLAFIFCSTLFTYNFQRLVKLKFSNFQPISGPRAQWVEQNIITVYIFTVLSAAGGLYFGWSYFEANALVVLVVVFLSFFYVWRLPLLKKNIRSIPGIKIFVLSGTWLLATNILPFHLFSEACISVETTLVFFNSFLFIFSISIPFDIRDLSVDDKKLKTIPQLIGASASIWLGICMLLASVIIVLLVTEFSLVGIMLYCLITALVIYFSDRYKTELLYSGLVDGALLIQGIFIYYWK